MTPRFVHDLASRTLRPLFGFLVPWLAASAAFAEEAAPAVADPATPPGCSPHRRSC